MRKTKGHELVPGRMKLDPVQTVAETIMRAQLRTVLVGQSSKVLHLFIARQRTDRSRVGNAPGRMARHEFS
jgi:hypothetical protein